MDYFQYIEWALTMSTILLKLERKVINSNCLDLPLSTWHQKPTWRKEWVPKSTNRTAMIKGKEYGEDGGEWGPGKRRVMKRRINKECLHYFLIRTPQRKWLNIKLTTPTFIQIFVLAFKPTRPPKGMSVIFRIPGSFFHVSNLILFHNSNN